MARKVTNQRIYCQLANMIDGCPKDIEPGRQWNNAWVQMLVEMVDERRAEVATMCSKQYETVEEIAARAGVEPEEIRDDLYKAAVQGVLIVINRDGKDMYKLHGWVPGIGETVLTTKDIDLKRAAELFFYGLGEETPDLAEYSGFAVGDGSLRAIPIYKAVKVEKSLKSFEQVKTYLDNSDIFSIADCACRRGKAAMGEPCEHPIEDTCLQIGDSAEYYIRTGRGRQVTREEAEELLLRAERNGLVHQALNTEGSNKSSFICNCCGCGCGSLTKQNWYRTPDVTRSNYIAEVDPEKCVACGACVEICNMNAVRLGTSFCSMEEQTPVTLKTPEENEWTVADTNPDWLKRVMVCEQGTSPCKTRCPAHISIQGYIRKAAEGKYDEALKIIKRENPFPAVCGRICPHSCEDECTRARVDEAIAIDDIKRFIADKELESENRYIPTVYDHYEEKVAVIGAGPAGLTCAYFLAAEGYPVTVFEKEDKLGGMLRFGIPSFRLEKDIIDAEIEVLRQLGVEFRTGVEVGREMTIDSLRKDGYRAFYIAIGAQKGRSLGVEGELLEGVISGVDFLREIAFDKAEKLSGKTVVIGGGNVAIDVARSAIRLEAESVEMYCLESEEEMPALKEEREEAVSEKIVIRNSWGPKRIIGENGKVTGVEFKRCVSVFNEEHRFAPVYDENDTIVVPCDNVLVSIGQSIDWGELVKNSNAKLTGRGTLEVKEISYQTEEPDIFAGGDAVTGPKFAIDAIATGKSGAISIHRFIRGRGITVRREREYKPFAKDEMDYSSFDSMPRQRPVSAHADQKASFEDVRKALTEEQLKKEAERCLGCGVSVVDPYMCIGCGLCNTKCEFDAIHLVKKYDVEPAKTTEEYFGTLVSHMTKRYEKLAAKKAAEKGETKKEENWFIK